MILFALSFAVANMMDFASDEADSPRGIVRVGIRNF